MLSSFINIIVPIFIHILELMGIFVLVISAARAFLNYVRDLFSKEHNAFKYQFALSMATALEFKLAAEILKTVIVRTVDEIAILAAVIVLRGIMSLIIHLEMKAKVKHEKN